MEKQLLNSRRDPLAVFSYLMGSYEKIEPDSPWSFKVKDEEQWAQVVPREIPVRCKVKHLDHEGGQTLAQVTGRSPEPRTIALMVTGLEQGTGPVAS